MELPHNTWLGQLPRQFVGVPLIYHAKSKYALDKRKGRLPSYLGNEGLYQKTVKGVPPIIYHAESNYALKKWKGRLPSYLGNEGSYQKTVKGIPSLIYHAKSKYALEKWKGCPEHSRTF